MEQIEKIFKGITDAAEALNALVKKAEDENNDIIELHD